MVHVEPIEKPNASYGRAVGVRSQLPDGRFVIFYYTHCNEVAKLAVGAQVRQQQKIATVGHSGTAQASAPHLHFEVILSPDDHRPQIPTDRWVEETVLGGTGPRLDPLEVLEQLGPWGMREVYLPTASVVTRKDGTIGAKSLDDDVLRDTHDEVRLGRAGFYPLGINNTWHGGVHLTPSSAGAPLFAPFDAEIVALRLDADPTSSTGMYGSTNFILLRHELSEPVANLLQGKPPGGDEPGKGKGKGKGKGPPAGVGRGATNPPDEVVLVKARLHAIATAAGTPYYVPEELHDLLGGVPDERLYAAIDAFQNTLPRPKKMKKARPWPDGVITKGGYTWKALMQAAPAPEPAPSEGAELEGDDPQPDDPVGGDTVEPQPPRDPKRTLYCLSMHVGAASLASQTRMPWLARARVALRPGNADDAALEQQRLDRAADETEAHEHALLGRVGFPAGGSDTNAGTAEDIAWVSRRLTRFGMYSGPVDGVWSEALREAIATLQSTYVDYYAGGDHGPAPGYVLPKGDTAKALRTPQWRLDQERETTIDPLFAARVAERDAHGRAAVVSGLAIAVRAGEPLWPAGKITIVSDGTPETRDGLHLEIFAEHAPCNWPTLIDDTEDLALDVPSAFFDAVEIVPGFAKDRWLEADEIRGFYADVASEPMRRLQCKFRSEWDLDIPGWLRQLEELGFDPSGIADALDAHMFWQAATDVLPPSSHVWHVHPVELLGRYREVLKTLEPPPPTSCRVDVQVRFADGQGWPGARLQLETLDAPLLSTVADAHGSAAFEGVGNGSGIVWVDEQVDGGGSFVDIDPGETQVAVEIVLDVLVADVATGTLDVVVVDGNGVLQLGLVVELLTECVPVEPVATDVAGTATFGALLPGVYQAIASGVRAPSVEVRRDQRQAVTLELALGRIEVRVIDSSGAPIVDAMVYVADDDPLTDGYAGQGRTDADGLVGFLVRAMSYDVWVHGVPEASTTIDVGPGETIPTVLHIDRDLVPSDDLEQGAIDVFVHDAGGAGQADVLVSLVDDAWQQITSARTGGDGRCQFEALAPGSYGVSVEGGRTDTGGLDVVAGARLQVVAQLGPAIVVTGTLMVSVYYTDGVEFSGTLKVTRSGGTLLRSETMSSAHARIEDLEPGALVVYVDGFDAQAVRIDLPPGDEVPLVLMLPGAP